MVATPCVDLCKLDQRRRVCTGCLRTAEEIARWRSMTDHQRRRVMNELPLRRARIEKQRP